MAKKITFRRVDLLENVSKPRYALAIIAGLLFSFVFYAFFFSLREIFRVLFSTVIDSSYIFIFEDNAIWFYNFIFALFSSILGLSIALKIIFEKPKQFGLMEKQYYRKSMIFNNLSFLNLSTLGIIIRLVPIPIFIFGTVFSYYLSYFEEYRFLIYFILIVLFLEQWKTIRLIYKNKALKWMAISLIGILIYSFAISTIDIVDYKKVNNILLSKQVTYNYELALPETSHYKKIERRLLAPEFFIAYPKNNFTHDGFPSIIFERVLYRIERLPFLLASIRDDYSEFTLPLVVIKLNADKHIKMRYINQIKDSIAKNGFSKIVYGVTIKDSEIPKELQFDIGAFERLQNVKYKGHFPPTFELSSIPPQHLFIIKLLANGKTEVNGKIDTIRQDSLKEFILKTPKENYFYIALTKASTLQDYITAKEKLVNAYEGIRDEYCIEKYGMPLDALSRNEKRLVKMKYPQLIILGD